LGNVNNIYSYYPFHIIHHSANDFSFFFFSFFLSVPESGWPSYQDLSPGPLKNREMVTLIVSAYDLYHQVQCQAGVLIFLLTTRHREVVHNGASVLKDQAARVNLQIIFISTQVKNVWAANSALPYIFMAWFLIKHTKLYLYHVISRE
jgi:hypothetical protein